MGSVCDHRAIGSTTEDAFRDRLLLLIKRASIYSIIKIALAYRSHRFSSLIFQSLI